LEQSKNRGGTECKQGKTELVEIDILISWHIIGTYSFFFSIYVTLSMKGNENVIPYKQIKNLSVCYNLFEAVFCSIQLLHKYSNRSFQA
jgi:hypothetical protein